VGQPGDGELSAIGVKRGIACALDLPPIRAVVSRTPDASFGIDRDGVVLWECGGVDRARCAWVKLYAVNTPRGPKAGLNNPSVRRETWVQANILVVQQGERCSAVC